MLLSRAIQEPGAEAWKASWNVGTIDAAKWSRIRQWLRDAYLSLRGVIEERGVADARCFGGALSAMTRAVYRLETIRQKQSR